MKTAALTTLILAIIASTMALPLSFVAKARADNDILNLLLQPSALSGTADAANTTKCFNYYMPILNQISLNFSLQYEQCVGVANQAAAKLSSTAAKHRAIYVNETAGVCTAFTSCNGLSDNLDFFNCYSTAASADVNEFYNLSDSATNVALSLKAGLQQIEYTKDICTNDAQHTYTMKTSNTYRALYACFANGLSITSISSGNYD